MDDFLTDNKKKYNTVLLLSAVIVVALLVLVEVLVESRANMQNARGTAEIILTDVVGAMEQNERDKALMVDSQKQACISYARSVAYMLEHNPEAVWDTAELRRLTASTPVDEIHLFDAQGTIVNGTIPEYFGINMSAGYQIRYFLPMLSNKKMAMCQDITPNTAEGRQMMYAAVWNNTGTQIVQVGVEPLRLIEELRQNELKHLVRMMPASEGMSIFVAGQDSGEIYGATKVEYVGFDVSDLGISTEDIFFDGIRHGEVTLNGVEYLCSRQLSGPYIIGVFQEVKQIQRGLLTSVLIVLVYLGLAALVIWLVIRSLQRRVRAEAKERERQHYILHKMSEIYYSLHLVYLDEDRAEEIYAAPLIHDNYDVNGSVSQQIGPLLVKLMNPAYVDRMRTFVDFSTLPERMKERNIIYEDFLGNNIWIRAAFVVIERREDGAPRIVIFRTLDINDEKQKEIKLWLGSTTDGLTGCLNRHACDMVMEKYENAALPENFVLAVMDVNGLKRINDDLGHQAGDELICGAADTIRAAFKPYGKVYRMGGDEFMAIFEADEEHLQAVKDDFAALQKEWRGRYVNELNISVGYAAHGEFPGLTLVELSKEADKRMYQDKSSFYRNRGFDRRGQQAANTALCDMYTKILQGNLTTDTYQIIRMSEQEKSAAYGFTGQLSSWLQDFGTAGRVHKEDLQEYLSKTKLSYLQEYFRQGNTRFLHIYRRKREDGFHRVMMEIIPAKDYAETNQSIYLYVKDIDQ